jgi:PAS domain S-box-containing protein
MAIALKENRSLRREMYVERPDAVRRHVICYPQPVHDDEGNVIGAMNVHIDITDRKETEQALKISEDRFRLLANSMPQMIWTADAEGNLNYFSEPVFAYSGLDAERIFREGWLEIVHPDDRPGNIELWTKAVQTGTPFNYEHRFRRHDGEYRWQLSRAIPQYDDKGNIRMWVGTSTDIHDKRVFADELAAQVEERTAELKLSNESLLRSNSELMQFAYVASHDLQEPLRKIQTFVSRIEEMESGNMTEKGRDYFARIQNASARTQKLIKDLLAFSRTNTLEKSFERTDLNDILGKVKDDLNELLQQNRVTIANGELPVLPAISFQFAQLFTNLITNSVKFAKKEQNPVITITSGIVEGKYIKHESASPDKVYHHISFSDNGIGFDPQFNERVFLVFQRLHTREAYEGTGIGLAICKRIAENHNGFITATGIPGEGASFNVYIPQLRAETE